MAITARKLVYDVNRKLHAVNSGGYSKISVLDLVSYINDAYEIVVENNIKLAESSQVHRNNLRKLEIKNFELPLENKGDYYYAAYPSNFYYRISHVAEVKCNYCEKTKIIVPRIVQSDDLHEARKNPYRRADYGWEQLIMDESGDGLYLYTDKEMDVCSLKIDYYRKINYIQAPSLVDCNDFMYQDYDDKLITSDVNFDLDNVYIARKVTDVAVLLIDSSINNVPNFELKLKALLHTEQIK